MTSQESAVPESSWHSRPYLGYDWIAGEGRGYRRWVGIQVREGWGWTNLSLDPRKVNG